MGTFFVLQIAGFSINFLTLFGLILAIGIVMNDVVLVVENVERLAEEEPELTITQIVKKAMLQLIGPIIATTLVLVAVFVPVSLMPDLTGSIYRQFAITICFFCPYLLCQLALSSPYCYPDKATPRRQSNFILFRWFDLFFDKTTVLYTTLVSALIRARYLVTLVFMALLLVTYHLFTIILSDGALMVMLNLKPGSSIEKTAAVRREFEELILAIPGIKDLVVIDGYNILSFSLDSSAAQALSPLFLGMNEPDPNSRLTPLFVALLFRDKALPKPTWLPSMSLVSQTLGPLAVLTSECRTTLR